MSLTTVESSAHQAPLMSHLHRQVRPISLSLWDSFSDEERTNCFGRLYEKRWNSRYRWEVRGQLNDMWKQDIRPVLEKLEQDNYAYIYGSGSRFLDRRFEIALLCHSQNRDEADPTVLIILWKKRIGIKMKSLFEKHQHFKGLNSGLGFDVKKGRARFLAADALPPTLSTKTNGQFNSLCGSAAFVTKLPPTEESIWRKITIGGVIHDPNTEAYYAVTARHCFGQRERYDYSNDNDSSDSDTQSHPDYIEASAASDQESGIRHQNDHPFSPDDSQHDVTSGVYLDCAPDDEPKQEDVSSKMAPRNLALVGEESLPTGLFQVPLDALDCTLVRILDTRFMQRNRIQTSWDAKLLPRSVQPNYDAPFGEAILASGSSGIKKVTISGTEVSFSFPWNDKSQVMWTLETEIVPGDSGSWILSPDGNIIYGMVVANAPESKMAYLIRGEDLLKTIALNLGLDVSPDEILPTNELKDRRAVKAGLRMHDRSTVDDPITNARTTLLENTALERSPRTSQDQDQDLVYSSKSTNVFRNTTPFSEVGDLERQLLDEIELLQLKTRWPDFLVSFLKIPQGNVEACRHWLISKPVIVLEDENLLVEEAVAAYRRRYKVFTYTCVERIAMIIMLTELAEPSPHDFGSFLEGYVFGPMDLQPRFDSVLQLVKSKGTDLNFVPIESFSGMEDPSALTRNTTGDGPKLETGYRVHSDKHAIPFFQIGRVFSTYQLGIKTRLRQDNNGFFTLAGKADSRITKSLPRSYVVVRLRNDHCECAAINTYQDRGDTFFRFYEREIKDCVPIAAVETRPKIHNEEIERGMTTDCLFAEPSGALGIIAPMSRVGFRKSHIFSLDTEVKNIGLIADKQSLALLRRSSQWWFNEALQSEWKSGSDRSPKIDQKPTADSSAQKDKVFNDSNLRQGDMPKGPAVSKEPRNTEETEEEVFRSLIDRLLS